LHTTVSSHEIDDTDPHPPLVPEWYSIPDQTRSAVSSAQKEGRAVIALGTTVVRALETWARTGHDQGWTTHLVTPDSPPLFVNGLVTGLHDNFTSHLWLLYAFVPPHHLVQAYRQAVERGYRWHEFGDLCFIRRI
jgi:S-adenosylmethionine:tRNA ribosyltransferase-isomerase